MPFDSLMVAGRVALLLVALQCAGGLLGWAGGVALGTITPIPLLSDGVLLVTGAVATGFFATGSAARIGTVKPSLRLALSTVSILVALGCFRLGPSPDTDGVRGDVLAHLARRLTLWGTIDYLLVLALRLPRMRERR